MSELRAAENSVSAKALEFCILTATRTNETLGIVWTEVDLAKGVWTIPAKRMKAGNEQRIPLSPRAVQILQATKVVHTTHNPHAFFGYANGS